MIASKPRPFAVLLVGALAASTVARAATDCQEKGDMVFRDLAAPIVGIFEDHGAIYEGKRLNPQSKQGLVEMLGDAHSSCPNPSKGCARFTELQDFKDVTGSYHGSFDFNAPNRDDRQAFVNNCRALIGLEYTDDFLKQFVRWDDDDQDGKIDSGETVRTLRSDAYTEYCYTKRNKLLYSPGADFWAAQGEPFGQNMLDNPALYDTTQTIGTVEITKYRPQKQRGEMTPSTCDLPLIDIFEFTTGKKINDGESSSEPKFKFKVTDAKSGPGCIEVWKGNPGTVVCGDAVSTSNGATRVFLDNDVYNAVENEYAVDGLTDEGLYFAKAEDAAGNESISVSFRIGEEIEPPPSFKSARLVSDRSQSEFIQGTTQFHYPLVAVSDTGFSSIKIFEAIGNNVDLAPTGQPISELSPPPGTVAEIDLENFSSEKGKCIEITDESGDIVLLECLSVEMTTGEPFESDFINLAKFLNPTQKIATSHIFSPGGLPENYIVDFLRFNEIGIDFSFSGDTNSCEIEEGETFTPSISGSFGNVVLSVRHAQSPTKILTASFSDVAEFELDAKHVLGDPGPPEIPAGIPPQFSDFSIAGNAKYLQARREITPSGGNVRLGFCTNPAGATREIIYSDPILSVGSFGIKGLVSIHQDPTPDATSGFLPVGSTANLPNGIFLTYDLVTAEGRTYASPLTDISPPSGWTSATGNTYYDIFTTAVYTGNVLVHIPVSTMNFTAEQLQSAKMFHCPANAQSCHSLQTTIVNGAAEATVDTHGRFTVLIPSEIAPPLGTDNAAPVTTLVVATPTFSDPLGRVFGSEESAISLQSFDEGGTAPQPSGVERTLISFADVFVDSTTTPTFIYDGTAFGLDEGTYTIHYFSIDNAGNAEFPKSQLLHIDAAPPETAFSLTGPQVLGVDGSSVVAPSSQFVLTSTDPVSNGVSAGVAGTFYLDNLTLADCGFTDLASIVIDPGAPPGTCAHPIYNPDQSHNLSSGDHVLTYLSLDNVENTENPQVRGVTMDPDPPEVIAASIAPGALINTAQPLLEATLQDLIAGISTTSLSIAINGATVPVTVAHNADETPTGVASSATVTAQLEQPLASGEFTLTLIVTDRVGNGFEEEVPFTVVAESVAALNPSTGPVGIPFTLTGEGFGPYAGANTQIRFGTTAAQITVWNDTTIKGKVPGLPAGVYAATRFRQHPSSSTSVALADFEITELDASGLTPDNAPIGVSFTLTGPGFGPYAGANSRVLIGTTPAQVTVWNDNTIKAKVPALLEGAYALTLEREIAGFVSASASTTFTVTPLAPTALAPASAPIGETVTLTGPGFGPYAGANSRVLFGTVPAQVTVWNDATIKAKIPGVSSGTYDLVLERKVGAYSQFSDPLAFSVTLPAIASVSPPSAPIGQSVTILGESFGAYAGANTRVFFDATPAQVTVWNNTTIKVKVPGMEEPGLKDLVVERRSFDGGIARSTAASFQVAGLAPDPIVPSSGPIGIPFTISGMDFGSYAGAGTRVLFGSTAAVITVWNDSEIKGRVPALSAGDYAVTVERQDGGDISSAFVSTFTRTDLAAAVLTPGAAPVGAPFTIEGGGFGPYAGANTRVTIAGSTAAITVWNDAQIKGRVPGVAAGETVLVIEREEAGIVQVSGPAVFTVAEPQVAQMTPPSGPTGITVTFDGSGFGPYAGANTQLKIGGVAAVVTVWNDTQIKAKVPPLAPGEYETVILRHEGAYTQTGAAVSFTVTDLAIASVTPSSGPIGITITLAGGPFGPYAGAASRLRIGVSTATVTVWNDTTIKGKIPDLAAGLYPLWIERDSDGGVQASSATYFEVLTPSVASLTPSSAPIGAPFELSGSAFGPYAGSATKVYIGGQAATITVWNDKTIKGKVPGVLTPGTYELFVERASGAGMSQSATQAFEVLLPTIATMTPTSGVTGTVVTLDGSGFGPYAGSQTRLLVGGTAVSVSVWNNARIRWTVPDTLAEGTHAVVVERVPPDGSVQSAPVSFTKTTAQAFAGGDPTPLAALSDASFEGELRIASDEGGTVETPAKAAVEIPPAAIAEDTAITVKRPPGRDKHRDKAMEHNGVAAAGEPIEFGPEGTKFEKPVTITLPYDAGLQRDGLEIHYWNPDTKSWEALPSTVDYEKKVVRAQTTHFSLYQVLGTGGVATTGGAAFAFGDVFVYPNPAVGGVAPTFHVEAGFADSVDIKVYDIAGRQLRRMTLTGAPSVVNGKYAYRAPLNGRFASGVYLYAIRAKKGGAELRKTGKFAVVR